jgi:hypothetical protein
MPAEWSTWPAARHLPGIEQARAYVGGEPGAGWALALDVGTRAIVVVPAAVGVAALLGSDYRRAAWFGLGLVAIVELVALYHARSEFRSGAHRAASSPPKLTIIEGGAL